MSDALLGLKIGHATHGEYRTGCTVFLCPPGTVGSVDIRGPAPGSREAALMAPDKPIDKPNAILLTGGSAFGLAAADGVMRYLADQGIGHVTPIRPIPIVPTAVVYDLFLGGGEFTPDASLGRAACEAATSGPVAQGNVGAGAGVTVGKWAGFDRMMKGGFGLATASDGALVVGAGAVVNAVGDVVGDDGVVLAGARGADGRWLAERDRYRRFPPMPPSPAGTNTTLVVIFTNANLSKVLAHRLAQRGHDGLAIAIRPAHTSHDGDTIFALSTGGVEANFDLVANMAVEVVGDAVRSGVRHAATVAGVPGLSSSRKHS